MVQRFRISLHRVLGRGIERAVRHRQEAEDRSDVDDATAALASHVRHDSARHPDQPEKVGFEDRPRLIDRAFGAGGGDAEAGIVHEHIDAAIAPHHFAYGSLH